VGPVLSTDDQRIKFFADPTSPRHKHALEAAQAHHRSVCVRGARLAARTLKTMGYEDVAILDGGLKAWTEAGLPTNEREYSGI